MGPKTMSLFQIPVIYFSAAPCLGFLDLARAVFASGDAPPAAAYVLYIKN
jgi:hypothetical protein